MYKRKSSKAKPKMLKVIYKLRMKIIKGLWIILVANIKFLAKNTGTHEIQEALVCNVSNYLWVIS